jgi:hypothetical protein
VIIQELIENTTLQEVQDALLKLYPKEMSRISEGVYARLLVDLERLTPSDNVNHMTVHVESRKDRRSEQIIWSTGYSTDRRYHHKYDLQFASKEQILSFEVDNKDLALHDAGAYLAHVLFDIARDGQMEEVYEEIQCVNPKQPSITRGFVDFNNVEEAVN